MIAIVIVLYKQRIVDSKTINSLKDLDFSLLKNNFKVLVYDNSPTSSDDKMPAFVDEYYSDVTNAGLNVAYNYAIDFACKNSCDWLVTLDQDTKLSSDYFKKLLSTIEREKNIVAIVPKIIGQNDKLISPSNIDNHYNFTAYPIMKYGIEQNITAINSACAININFITSIGGYSKDFRLDLLDHWLFNEINLKSKNIYVLDEKIYHELSVLDYNNSMNINRYKSIIESEILFFHKYKESQLIHYRKKLFLRAIKQLIMIKNKEYYKVTIDARKRIKKIK